MEIFTAELIELLVLQFPNFLFALIFVLYTAWKDQKQDRMIEKVLDACLSNCPTRVNDNDSQETIA